MKLVPRLARSAAIIALTAYSVAPLGAADDAPSAEAQVPLAPPSVVGQAAELAQSSLTAPDAATRKRLLAKAQTLLETFLKETPTHPDAPQVEMQLGAVLVAAGRGLAGDAATAAEPAPREELLSEARRMLVAAETRLAVAIDQFRSAAKPGSQGHGDPNSTAMKRRNAARGYLMQSLMYYAGAREELALTYPVDSAEARDSFQVAADRYDQIYKDYRTFLAGLTARLKQGQCYKQLGDTRRALGLYNDLLTQPDDLPVLHRLRVSAMYLSLECWTTEQEKLYELAFSQGEEYLSGLRPEEKSWPEWQAVRYYTALGYRLAADAQPESKPAAQREADRRSWLEAAGSHAAELAEEAGPYQAAAGELAAAVEQLRQQ